MRITTAEEEPLLLIITLPLLPHQQPHLPQHPPATTRTAVTTSTTLVLILSTTTITMEATAAAGYRWLLVGVDWCGSLSLVRCCTCCCNKRIWRTCRRQICIYYRIWPPRLLPLRCNRWPRVLPPTTVPVLPITTHVHPTVTTCNGVRRSHCPHCRPPMDLQPCPTRHGCDKKRMDWENPSIWVDISITKHRLWLFRYKSCNSSDTNGVSDPWWIWDVVEDIPRCGSICKVSKLLVSMGV